MKKFFMKFLYFFGVLGFGFLFIVFCFVIFDKHDYDLENWFSLFWAGGMTLLAFWHLVSEEKEPEEKSTPEKLKTDNPNTNDPSKLYVFSGEKGRIIMVRDGKVIVDEKPKVHPDMYSRNSSYPDHL